MGKGWTVTDVGQRATRLDRNFNFSLDFPWVGDSKAEKDGKKSFKLVENILAKRKINFSSSHPNHTTHNPTTTQQPCHFFYSFSSLVSSLTPTA